MKIGTFATGDHLCEVAVEWDEEAWGPWAVVVTHHAGQFTTTEVAGRRWTGWGAEWRAKCLVRAQKGDHGDLTRDARRRRTQRRTPRGGCASERESERLPRAACRP